jgi:hypothetical protein
VKNPVQPFAVLAFLVIISARLHSQTISSSLPANVDNSRQYLFYLHGAIVQDEGVDAVSEYYGPYKYLDILDSLRARGFNVISERRPKGTVEEEYAEMVSGQIDSLLAKRVMPQNIVVVGASMGAAITIEIAHRLKNQHINYVVMGLCSDYFLSHFAKYRGELCGNFLSIYERSDAKGSCDELLKNLACKSGYKEVALSMGNSHGFLYRPYSEWINAIVQWKGMKK